MRGRLPLGPECVEHMPGSAQAKNRAKAIYETMTGRLRVQEACRRLGISEPRFDQLRSQMVTASIEGVESRPAGRPARRSSPEEQRIRELEAKLAEAELKLRIAQAREEIALTLPSVVRQPSADHRNNASDQEKKPVADNAERGPDHRLRGTHETSPRPVPTHERRHPQGGQAP